MATASESPPGSRDGRDMTSMPKGPVNRAGAVVVIALLATAGGAGAAGWVESAGLIGLRLVALLTGGAVLARRRLRGARG